MSADVRTEHVPVVELCPPVRGWALRPVSESTRPRTEERVSEREARERARRVYGVTRWRELPDGRILGYRPRAGTGRLRHLTPEAPPISTRWLLMLGQETALEAPGRPATAEGGPTEQDGGPEA